MYFPDKEFLVELTNAVYKLTLLFPKKEPLRYKLREVATDILNKPKEEDLRTMDSFLEVALLQDWVKTADILAIKEEYVKINNQLEEVNVPLPEPTIFVESAPAPEEMSPPEERPKVESNLDRQEEIIKFIETNGRAQVWQIKNIFPDISKRTLRRDFEKMLEQGLVEREGENNDIFYKIKTA